MVRPATADDAPAISAIYSHYVLTSLVTFEEIPPSDAEMADRIAAVQVKALPYLVAEEEGRVVGFAYASPFRPRAAYRYTAESTVYLSPNCLGRGLGKALVGEVVAACERLGLRQLVAVVGDSANVALIALHRSLGFEQTGVGHAFGYKFGRWVDIVMMQRSINGGSESQPAAPGLAL